MKTRCHKLKSSVILILILYSCNVGEQSIKRESAHDTIIKDIPRYPNGDPLPVYKSKLYIEDKLGLNSIESGCDSQEIRIWYKVALLDSLQVAILKNAESGWSAELFSIGLKFNDRRDSVISIEKRISKLKPTIQWPNVVDSLNQFGILTLPDSETIPGYSEANDGDVVIIEVAKIKFYRLYHFPNFRANPEVPEANRISQMMEFIGKIFNFKWTSLK